MATISDLYVKRQRAGLIRGDLSRRQFIASAVAAGIAVLAAISWADGAKAATHSKGGSLRIGCGSGSTPDSLDPATYEGTINTVLAYMLASKLVEVDRTGKIGPELAGSFETNDGFTWMFKLRPGVEFHNGKALAPEDVIALINPHRGADSKSAAAGLVGQIRDMRADGNSVVFELSAANADFPCVLSDCAEAQSLFNDDGGALIPMFAKHIMGVSKTIAHGDDIAPNWELNGARAPERWWKA